MAIEYMNRKKDTYYLHRGETKTGKPKYFFSKNNDGVLVESIPEDYEIYENPNARVFLRKIPPKIFTDEETAIVEEGMKQYTDLAHYKIDVKGKNITIFLPNQDFDVLSKLIPAFSLVGKSTIEEMREHSLSYSPEMRFVLIDKKKREFSVERWWWSEDEWIFLDSAKDLARLVKKYCKHLGKESLFELF